MKNTQNKQMKTNVVKSNRDDELIILKAAHKALSESYKQMEEKYRDETLKNANLLQCLDELKEQNNNLMEVNKKLMELRNSDLRYDWHERMWVAFLWLGSLGFAWFLLR